MEEGDIEGQNKEIKYGRKNTREELEEEKMKQGEKNRGEKSWMKEKKSDEKNVRKKLKNKLLMQVGSTYNLLLFADGSIRTI